VGTLSLSAHSLIDFPLDVPAIALSGAALAGVAFAGISVDERGHRAPERVPSGSATRSIVAGLSITLLALAAGQTAALATW
jgi:hypothetical protein